MDFDGLNLGLDPADLPDGAAVVADNAALQERFGQIGARPGKVFQNTAAYANDVYGVDRLLLPGGQRKWVVANDDGEANQVDAPLTAEATAPFGNSLERYTFDEVNFDETVIIVDYTVDMHRTLPAGDYELFWTLPDVTATKYTTNPVTWGLSIYLETDAAAIVWSGVLANFATVGESIALEHGSLSYRKVTATLTGDATKIRLRQSGLFANAVSGPFNQFWARG